MFLWNNVIKSVFSKWYNCTYTYRALIRIRILRDHFQVYVPSL